MSEKYLVLRLKGPMQSWGLRAKFDNRSTETMPTKSGIVGLLGAALGLARNDTAGIRELSDLKLMTICLKEGMVITDFHTVGAGHTNHEKCLPTATGKSKEAAVTNRQYLCDYEFLAVLCGDGTVIDRCAMAVRDSVYVLSLGRKSCSPSQPIFAGVYAGREGLKACLKSYEYREDMRVSCEVDKGGQLEQDVPMDFKTRKFTSRRISGDATDWLS